MAIRNLLPLLLLGSWPFIAFLATNKTEPLYAGSILRAWAIYVAVLLLALALLRVFVHGRAIVRAGHVAAVSTVVFFSYLGVSGFLSGYGVALGTVKLAIWMCLFVATGLTTWFLSRHRGSTEILTAAGLVMVLVPTYDLATYYLELHGDPRPPSPAAETTSGPIGGSVASDRRPNVYFLILDMYARADSLRHYFGYDNEPFLNNLRGRGFQVASRSYSNYDSTKFSISTTVQMDYHLPLDRRPNPSMWTEALQGFNRTVRVFRTYGYNYVHAGMGGSSLATRCGGGEDKCILGQPAGLLSLNRAEVNLLRLTPLYPVLRRVFSGLLSFDLIEVEDVMRGLRGERLSPFFLFAHVLSPHPPARYNADCSRRHDRSWDVVVRDDSYRFDFYVTDLKCLNRQLLAAIDEILDGDDSDPIIILQSDHGLRLDADLDEAGNILNNAGNRFKRLAILNAIRFPAACRELFYESVSPVNTFRMVFSCIAGRPYEMLPDRHYLHNPDLVEVDPAPLP